MIPLAHLYIETDRFGEALTLAADAKAICKDVYSDQHWRTASAATAEGAALAGLRRYEEAEAILVQSFTVLKNDASATSFYVANATRWLADLYQKLDKPDEAARYRAMLGDSENRQP
jgi:tetratricopeptide (TPR) repeat protein